MQNPLQNKGRFERGFSSVHLGIDWSSFENLPIFPAAGGVITYLVNNCPVIGYLGSSCGGGGGNWLEVTHGNSLKTRYLHFSKINVSPGQTVYKNTVLGYIGTSGSSTGKHLHFEVLKNNIRVNPLLYINNSSPNLLLILALVFLFSDELGINLNF